MSGFGGVGLVQSRGGGIVVMRPGDTIYTPPGEWHWHGAALNCPGTAGDSRLTPVSDVKSLTHGVGVPRGAGTRREPHRVDPHAGGRLAAVDDIEVNTSPVNISAGPLVEG